MLGVAPSYTYRNTHTQTENESRETPPSKRSKQALVSAKIETVVQGLQMSAAMVMVRYSPGYRWIAHERHRQ